MAETKLDFSANTAEAERNVQKLTKALAAAREENRKLNQSAKEGKSTNDSWAAGLERLKQQNDRWAQGMAKMQAMQPKKTVAGISLDSLHQVASGLGQMVGTLGGIGAAVGVATMAYSKWNQKIDEVIHGHTELSMSIVRTLAEAGKLSMGPEVEKWAKSQSGATPQQAEATIRGVMASGETLSNERTMAVATEMAKLAPTGIDLTAAGALSADIADIAGDNTSAGDIADITVGMKQQLREKTGLFSGPKFQKQVERLKRNTGMSGEDALAYAMAAAQGEVGAEGLSVAAMKPGERNQDQRRMMKDVFSPEKIAAAKANIQRFQTENLAAGELDALGGFAAGKEALGEQAVAREVAITEEKYGPAMAARRRFQKTVRERAYQESFVSGAITDIEQYTKGAIGDLTPINSTQQEARFQMQAGTISKQEYSDLITALNRNTEATKASTPQSRNADAHTE